MNKVKILHCADVHIGAAESFLGARAESRQAETLITFEKIIDIAKENDVQIMLISGDLFNSNNQPKSVIDRVFENFAKIENTKIIFCGGNHDPLNIDSPFKKYECPKNVYALDTKDSYFEFDELNTRVYGKSFKEVYMKGAARFSLTPSDDFINLMCIHGDLRNDLGSDYNSITSEFIESSGMDYIALGHIHKRTEVGKIGNTYLAYCGCPEGQGFDELKEKGIYLGEISKDGCNLRFVPTSKRMHICENVDISEASASSDIAEKVLNTLNQTYGDNFADNLYKIILTGEIDEDTDIRLPEIVSRLNDVLYFAKVRNKTVLKVDLHLLSKEKTLKGIFVKNMLNRISSANECDRARLEAALNMGLKAFSGEVSYDED